MPDATQDSALCCMSNVEALYVTQTELRSLVLTWTVLLKLGIAFEDPLLRAIVARAMSDGDIKLLHVQRSEVDQDGEQKISWEVARFLHVSQRCYSQDVSIRLR